MSFVEGDSLPETDDLSLKAKMRTLLSMRKKYLAEAGASVVFFASNAVSLADKYTTGGPRLRNLLPEPLDYFNHSGNFVLSMYAGGIATYIAARGMGRLENVPNTKARKLAIGTGILAATALNGISELKLGISFQPLVSPHDVADPIDLAYGVIAGTVASLGAADIYDGLKANASDAK